MRPTNPIQLLLEIARFQHQIQHNASAITLRKEAIITESKNLQEYEETLEKVTFEINCAEDYFARGMYDRQARREVLNEFLPIKTDLEQKISTIKSKVELASQDIGVREYQNNLSNSELHMIYNEVGNFSLVKTDYREMPEFIIVPPLYANFQPAIEHPLLNANTPYGDACLEKYAGEQSSFTTLNGNTVKFNIEAVCLPSEDILNEISKFSPAPEQPLKLTCVECIWVGQHTTHVY